MSKIWEKRNVNLFNCKLIMIPINISNFHWSLVTVNIQERVFSYYDSLNHETEGYKIMNALSELFSEYITRNKFKYDEYNLNISENNKNKMTTSEEEITVKLSNSFTSNINNINEVTINQTNYVENNLQMNTKINFADKDSDSENDLHMIASFWKYKFANVPKQSNGIDCGVFVCKFMEFLARDESISFSQSDMDYFRVLIGVEILESDLLSK